MKSTKCTNGHFYDADKYEICPHCDANQDPGHTVGLFPSNPPSGMFDPSADETVTLDKGPSGSPPPVPFPPQPAPAPAPESNYFDKDDPATISIFDALTGTNGFSPVVGWLVCVKGRLRGQDFRLKTGQNFVGRGQDMDVCLDGETSVSRSRHAVIVYEPKQNIFVARPGDSKELFYLNGNVVLSPLKVEKDDLFQIGDLTLRLIPCCDENFHWDAPSKDNASAASKA